MQPGSTKPGSVRLAQRKPLTRRQNPAATLNSAGGGLVYAPGTAATLTVTLSADDAQKDVLVTAGNVQLGAQAVLTATVTTGQMAMPVADAFASKGNFTQHLFQNPVLQIPYVKLPHRSIVVRAGAGLQRIPLAGQLLSELLQLLECDLQQQSGAIGEAATVQFTRLDPGDHEPAAVASRR